VVGIANQLNNCKIVQLYYCVRDSRVVYRILVRKPEGERPLGRQRRRWEVNIKMDLQEVGCGFIWTGLCWFRIETGGGHL